MLITASPVLNKALEGKRINEFEALDLLENASTLDLAYAANEIRRKFHKDSEPATYVVQRNINYSNVCTANCSFCAFYTPPVRVKNNDTSHTPPEHKKNDTSHTSTENKNKGAYFPDAYVLDYETQLKPKIQELVDINGTEILFQGGHNPALGLDYYQNLFQQIKTDFPGITLHALSPAEVNHITEKRITPPNEYGDGTNKKTIKEPNLEQIKETLVALQEAGMDSLPGAGAEILVESVREVIAPLKITSQHWLDIMEVAHGLGMRSSATMMYGHVESYSDRIEHLKVLREVQDRTNGFTAFVCWNFQRGNTPLGKIMDSYEKRGILPKQNANSSGDDYLRTLCVARIYLDNFTNFQASWVTQGTHLGQASLLFGCNDLGGNMMEENVVSAANTTHRASVDQMNYLISSAGFEPRQRDTQYNLL